MSENVDVVVVGLGPGGEAAATRLAEAGMDVVGVDERLVGGECPYFACVPTKMMVRAAGALVEAQRARGLAGDSAVTPSWAPVAARISEEATAGWDDDAAVKRLEEAGVTFVRGRGRLAGPRTVEVGGTTYAARKGVLLNTGTAPAAPPIDGLADTPYWTNRDAVQLTELPGSLIVIGGGPVGAELAQVFSRFGVQVSVIEVTDRILKPEEPESSELVTDVFVREGITVITDTEVSSVSYDEGSFAVALPDRTLHADKLLVAAGRRPNLSDLGLESVGLDGDARVLEVDGHLRVADGLWAIGDITAKGPWTHTSMYQAGIAAQDILGEDGPEADYRAMPRVTFTDPEIGSVGLTERQARDQGIRVRVGLSVLSASARGWIHGPGNEGLIKLVEDADRGVLVGATSAGPLGGEVLSMLTTAVHAEIPTQTLRTMIYAYPTFHRAVEDALGNLA